MKVRARFFLQQPRYQYVWPNPNTHGSEKGLSETAVYNFIKDAVVHGIWIENDVLITPACILEVRIEEVQ